MDENLLQILEYTGEGYQPLVDFGAWRVAFLRYIDELIPGNITRVERHCETDEVFVLLQGSALLFVGGGEKTVENLTPVVMQPGKLYNVRRNTWHTVVLSHDATILLVENRDTTTANSNYVPLSADQRRMILEMALREQPGEWA